MTRYLKASILLAGFVISLLQVSVLAAQQSKPTPEAPIPAHKDLG